MASKQILLCSWQKFNGSETFTWNYKGFNFGLIFYAIYVTPLFDSTDLTNFSDDNFILRWNSTLVDLIDGMKRDLEMINKWLRDSGLVVNESKTELCLFNRRDTQAITIIWYNLKKKEMYWVQSSISKCNGRHKQQPQLIKQRELFMP